MTSFKNICQPTDCALVLYNSCTRKTQHRSKYHANPSS